MDVTRRFFLKGSAATAFAGAFGLPKLAETSPVSAKPLDIGGSDFPQIINAQITFSKDVSPGGPIVGPTKAEIEMECVFDSEDWLLEEVRDMVMSGDSRELELNFPNSSYTFKGSFFITGFYYTAAVGKIATYQVNAVADGPVEVWTQ